MLADADSFLGAQPILICFDANPHIAYTSLLLMRMRVTLSYSFVSGRIIQGLDNQSAPPWCHRICSVASGLKSDEYFIIVLYIVVPSISIVVHVRPIRYHHTGGLYLASEYNMFVEEGE